MKTRIIFLKKYCSEKHRKKKKKEITKETIDIGPIFNIRHELAMHLKI